MRTRGGRIGKRGTSEWILQCQEREKSGGTRFREGEDEGEIDGKGVVGNYAGWNLSESPADTHRYKYLLDLGRPNKSALKIRLPDALLQMGMAGPPGSSG